MRVFQCRGKGGGGGYNDCPKEEYFITFKNHFLFLFVRYFTIGNLVQGLFMSREESQTDECSK